jgi:alkylation response protein AidB-like acyl-CoA dehydrogenase
MDFALSEEQELLQETVRSFVEKECPAALARQVFDGDRAPVAKLWGGLVEIGVAGLVVPERQGGAGLALLELALVSEELGRGVVPVPFLGHALACLALAHGGSPAQQERWLPELASGELLGAVAFGELAPNVAEADVLVAARADGRLALFEAKDVRCTPLASNDRGRPLARVTLSGAGDALPRAELARLRDAALVLLAADAFGAAHRLVRMTVEYAKTRQQFGQPIAQFQALKHQLANMAVEVDPARGLWWYAAHAYDHEPRERAARAAALAKAHVTDRAMQAARDAVECHGGIGFTWECDVQLWFKRILLDRQWLGTPEEHRERIAQMNGY